ncbi:hypothetical protein SADUNF_Sadunf07G0058700 [Salix dunnii]|uniref:Chromo domain-containing protein n=1 Tax=Salix dunnii TaxID=1413687 RepID=A0A835MV86_9ROSI|nr:hypothetical protein SADUNF_Sadunf07G0058700 [Salix dunnii]
MVPWQCYLSQSAVSLYKNISLVNNPFSPLAAANYPPNTTTLTVTSMHPTGILSGIPHFKAPWRRTSKTFQNDKTYALVADRFYSPRLRDTVLVRLKPEHFPPGSFTKLHARRAGPFKIIKKLGSNAYVVGSPAKFNISHVFNIEDITAFKGELSTTTVQDIQLAMPLPENTSPRDEVAAILDHQFVSTRRGGYYKFLVQWKNHPHSESVWLQASELQQLHPHLFTTYLHHNLSESIWGG